MPKLNESRYALSSPRRMPRAMLPRVFGSSPLMTLPAIVPSIDSELSRMIMTFGLIAGARNSG